MADTEHYDLFREFARTKYEGCTLEQKLQMYLNHHPIRAVPLLAELIVETHRVDWLKKPEEKPGDSYARTD